MFERERNRSISFAKLASDTGWAVASSAFLVLAGFLLNVLLGNSYGEDGLGVYTLVVTIYMLLSTIALLGIPISLTKYTAEHMHDPAIGAEFFSASLLMTALSTLAFGALLVTLRRPLSALFKTPELIEFLPIIACGFPFYGLNKVALGRLNGLCQMKLLAMGESLRYIFLVAITVVGIAWMGGGLASAIWAFPIAEMLLLPILVLATRMHRNLRVANLGKRCRAIRALGGQMVLARIIGETDARINTLVLAAFLTKAEVGIYSVAVLLSSGLDILPASLQKVTGPATAAMHAKEQSSAMEQMSQRTMLAACFLLTSAAILLVMFFPQIVALLYPTNPRFLLAETALIILVVGRVFRGIATSINLVFMSVNRPDVFFKVAIARLATNSMVTFLLVDALKMDGAALGNSAASLLAFALFTLLMAPIAGVRVDYKALLLMPLLGAVMTWGARLMPDSVPFLIARAFLWACFVLVAMRTWHLDSYMARLYQLAARRGSTE